MQKLKVKIKNVKNKYKKRNSKVIFNNIYLFFVLLLSNTYILAIRNYYQLEAFFALVFS